MPSQPLIAGIVLALLVLAAGVSDRTGRVGALTLMALSILWLRVNTSVEGIILIEFNQTRGFTGADLAGVAGLLLAVWRLSTGGHLSRHRSDK